MTNTSVKNPVSVLAIFALAIALFSGAFATVVSADEFDFSASAGDFGLNAGDFGGNAGDFTTNAGDFSTNAGDFSTNAGDLTTNAGNFTTDASNFTPDASNFTTDASSFDQYASNYDVYDVYDVYSTPAYDYSYSSYVQSYPYSSNFFPVSSFASPFFSSPSLVNAPTSINAPTNIIAPTNIDARTNTEFCNLPNSCNTTVDDHSVVNAPTYAQPATAYVSPVVQTIPYYTAQAYVPSYPTYTSPSYVYAAPAPYYAPVNPVVNPSPYVALTQIPYTGLDLGFFGNALYWLALIGVALAGAYLLVYYLPSLKFRQANSRGAAESARRHLPLSGEESPRDSRGDTSFSEETPVPSSFGGATGQAPSKSEGVTSGHLGNLSHTGFGTSDMMRVIKSAHGAAPRIVISRS